MSGSCVMEGKAKPEAEEEGEGETLTREAILMATDLEIEPVSVPEWGGRVFVRVMTGRERDAFDMGITEGGKKKAKMEDFRARFAAMVVCDEKGERLFTLSDIEALTKKNGSALDRIFDAGKRLNRIGEEEQQALVANFDQTPDGASGSA